MPRIADPTRPDAILDAARTVFLRDGYANARMADIAAEAGVAVGTLYLYFDSKEALTQALALRFFGKLCAAALPALEAIEGPDDVATFVHRMLGFARAGRDILRLVHPVLHGADGGADPAWKARGPERPMLTALISPVLAAKMDAGVLWRYDPDILAELLISIMQGAIKRVVFAEDDDADRYAANVIALLERALLVGQPAAPPPDGRD
jgi:AcrR family transcriptional regulator